MHFKNKFAFAMVGTALAVAALPASAVTLRIGNQGDALSMDPHSLNESLQISVDENVYEALVTGISTCARACSFMTAHRSPPTT
jgi:peptide/nickel transport system substrate-binding protein